MFFGGDYNPEQFTPDVWEEDIERMREACVDLVTVGVFSWSRIQPAEGEFDWEWLDTILDRLHAAGIGVDLATATASPPPWAIQRYPSMLPVDENGSTYWPGTRQHYAPTSPDYRRLSNELVSAIARRYARHPAVRMWHLNNELGCHIARDYSDHAAAAFRVWLRERYGDLDALNAAWGTTFWSGILTDFEQVFPPRKAPAGHNPSLLLDFRRFTSDALRSILRRERDILRAAGATQPITTNFMGLFPEADYWSWADDLDLVSDDNYPDPADPEVFRAAAFARDLMRSLKPGTPWLLMEQSTDAVTWFGPNASKAPGQMAALSAQAVGRGADGVLFFQWRQSTHGTEQFLTAMLPHGGTDTRMWREVTELGRRLAELPDLPPPAAARVAIVLDWESWWALDSVAFPAVVDYSATLMQWHTALHRAHIDVDFVRPSSDLSGYGLVIAPLLFLLTDADAENLSSYVSGGGHLLTTALADIVDETCGVRPGGYQTRLRHLLGTTAREFNALIAPSAPTDVHGARTAPFSGTEIGGFDGLHVIERLEVLAPDVEIHATFSDGPQRSDPALTSRSHGAGTGYHLATLPSGDGIAAILRWLLPRTGIESRYPELHPDIEAMRRGDLLTLVNQAGAALEARLPGRGPITLAPYEWQVLTDETPDPQG